MQNNCKIYFECILENNHDCDYYQKCFETQDCLFINQTECRNRSAQIDSMKNEAEEIITNENEKI